MIRYALALLVFVPTQALGISYSQWLTAHNSWKRGYVFAYAEYARTFATDEGVGLRYAKAYDKCFAGFSDEALLKIVEVHLDKNPALKTEPIIIGVNSAFLELCAKHLPK
jgi:hypothetical protein